MGDLVSFRGLTPAEKQNEYITIGGATFKTEDVEGFSQKSLKQNSVFLKNGVQIDYPGQQGRNGLDATVTLDKHGCMIVGGFSGGVITGSKKSDNIHVMNCQDLQIDVKGGNSIFRGDNVNYYDGSNKNINVKSDSRDTVITPNYPNK